MAHTYHNNPLNSSMFDPQVKKAAYNSASIKISQPTFYTVDLVKLILLPHFPIGYE